MGKISHKARENSTNFLLKEQVKYEKLKVAGPYYYCYQYRTRKIPLQVITSISYSFAVLTREISR